jgi:hypothetical protein
MRSFPELGLNVFVAATYRYSGTNFDGYRIGDEIVASSGCKYSMSEYFAAVMLLRSRFALQDYANRRTLSATGGTYHDIMPAIVYVDGPSHFRAFAQLPLYRNVRGIQLTLSYLLGIEYSYTIDFGPSFSVE